MPDTKLQHPPIWPTSLNSKHKIGTLQLRARATADVLVEERTRIARVALSTAARCATRTARIRALNHSRRVGLLGDHGARRTRLREAIVLAAAQAAEIIAIAFAPKSANQRSMRVASLTPFKCRRVRRRPSSVCMQTDSIELTRCIRTVGKSSYRR